MTEVNFLCDLTKRALALLVPTSSLRHCLQLKRLLIKIVYPLIKNKYWRFRVAQRSRIGLNLQRQRFGFLPLQIPQVRVQCMCWKKLSLCSIGIFVHLVILVKKKILIYCTFGFKLLCLTFSIKRYSLKILAWVLNVWVVQVAAWTKKNAFFFVISFRFFFFFGDKFCNFVLLQMHYKKN